MSKSLIYLTKTSKIYYSDALREVIECKEPFWKLDDGLEDYLLLIDQNKNISTLYSKFSNSSTPYVESYLRFAFTKNTEKEIVENIKPIITQKYKCIFELNQPKITQKIGAKINLKCVKDPHYFNILNFQIRNIRGSINQQLEFWVEITEMLSKI
jgi:hypothetical protein